MEMDNEKVCEALETITGQLKKQSERHERLMHYAGEICDYMRALLNTDGKLTDSERIKIVVTISIQTLLDIADGDMKVALLNYLEFTSMVAICSNERLASITPNDEDSEDEDMH